LHEGGIVDIFHCWWNKRQPFHSTPIREMIAILSLVFLLDGRKLLVSSVKHSGFFLALILATTDADWTTLMIQAITESPVINMKQGWSNGKVVLGDGKQS
jgi:hypothetical protein